MTMTYILSEYFGCMKPFRKTPERIYDKATDTVTEKYTTDNGDKAYAKLVSLLCDVSQISGVDVSVMLDKMDDMMLTGKGAYERGE